MCPECYYAEADAHGDHHIVHRVGAVVIGSWCRECGFLPTLTFGIAKA